ncbi:MAG TPA: hypothetical protein VF698_02630, partial [Thermoanaerobaculia bacterium]
MSIFPAPSEAAVPATAPPTVVTRRSAGRAWLFSLLLPGAGQIYCDAWMRGWATLTVFFFAAIVAAAAAGDASYVALRLAIFLHVFGHLDAYFTARETHRGIEPGADDNPRVAAMLNLVTGLWGYVYLGAINLGKCILLLFALRGLTK